MNRAIVDLGSNTFNLLVFDQDCEFIVEKELSVKLGKRGYNNGVISEDRMIRAARVLNQYKKVSKEYGVSELYALGTSAIRNAENKDDFVHYLSSKINVYVNVISGKEEATLIGQGVLSQPIPNLKSLVLDIGGGSCEFVLLENQRIIQAESFDLGVSRLKEKFNIGEELTAQELVALNEHFDKTISAFIGSNALMNADALIGASGSFETFHAMSSQSEQKKSSKRALVAFSISEFKELMLRLVKSKYQERLLMKGMAEMRADTIHISAALCLYLLEKNNFNHIQLSWLALKEGAMKAITYNNSLWQKSLL